MVIRQLHKVVKNEIYYTTFNLVTILILYQRDILDILEQKGYNIHWSMGDSGNDECIIPMLLTIPR